MDTIGIGGLAEGISQGIGSAVNLVSGIEQIEQQKQQTAINEIKLKEFQAQEKRRNTLVNLDSMFPNLDSFPSMKGKLMSTVQSLGYDVTDQGGIPYIKAGAIEDVRNALKGNMELQGMTIDAGIQDMSSQIMNINNKINSGEAKGKDLQQLLQTKERLMAQHTQAVNLSADIIKAKELQKMKEEPAVKKPTPPMYEEVPVGDDKWQKMRWNPETQQNDIPVGKPFSKKKDKTPITPSGARKRISSIETIKHKLRTTGGLEPTQIALMEALSPGSSSMMRSGDVDGAVKALDIEKEGLLQFLPESEREKYASTTTDYGASPHPEGTEATNEDGVTIITKGGKWVVK